MSTSTDAAMNDSVHASGHPIRAAEIVLPGARDGGLDATLSFFTDRLGFRIESIVPADRPAQAVLSGYGVRVRLHSGVAASPGVIQLSCDDPDAIADGARELIAPNGTRVLLVHADPPLELPPARPSLVVCRLGRESSWHTGRAGMRYRDVIPGRQGGRFIGSHIAIPYGGPVPDYVHFHKVHFQMIYCYRGWVRVVYEDQGPPFSMRAGDCVLQPPGIRHRVLESSRGLEVIEISCPAEHETLADHEMALPTSEILPDRQFAGQRFVRHRASLAAWQPGPIDGFESRDLGIARATEGLAGARVLRPCESQVASLPGHDGQLQFGFVLEGGLSLELEGHDARQLATGDSFALPTGAPYRFTGCAVDLEILEVSLPAATS